MNAQRKFALHRKEYFEIRILMPAGCLVRTARKIKMTAALLRTVEMNLQATRGGGNAPGGIIFPYSPESSPT